MKFFPVVLVGLALSTGAFAAETAAPAPAPAPAAKPGTPAPVPVTPPAPEVPLLKFDDYMADLTAAAKLTDDEKKFVTAAYQADGVLLKNVLNNDAISPLQKAQQVSEIREARNAKIEGLLVDNDRKLAFLKVEAKYRVGLMELAAEGCLMPAAPAPAAK